MNLRSALDAIPLVGYFRYATRGWHKDAADGLANAKIITKGSAHLVYGIGTLISLGIIFGEHSNGKSLNDEITILRSAAYKQIEDFTGDGRKDVRFETGEYFVARPDGTFDKVTPSFLFLSSSNNNAYDTLGNVWNRKAETPLEVNLLNLGSTPKKKPSNFHGW